MKKTFLALSLLAALTSVAQQKAKPKPQSTQKTTTKVVTDAPPPPDKVTQINVEGVKDDEGLVEAVVEAPVSRTYNGNYYISSNSQERNVTVAYKGENYSDKRYALIDYTTKKELTPFIFESISGSFYNSDNTVASLNGSYGIINNKGKVVLPFVYNQLSDYTVDGQQYYIASRNRKYGVITENGEVILPFEYENISRNYYSNNNLIVSKNKKSGLLNFVSKKLLLPIEYDDISNVLNAYFKVKMNSSYTMLNADGSKLFSKSYKSLYIYDENNILVEYNGKKGLVDINEKAILPIEYDELDKLYSSGATDAFLARKNGRYGVVRRDGSIQIPFEYDLISKPYSSENLLVTKGDKKGILTMEGKSVVPVEYDDIITNDKVFTIRKNGKVGTMSKDGVVIIPAEYDALEAIAEDGYYNSNGLILATKNGKKGILDKTGKVKVEVQYDDILASSRSSYNNTVSMPNPVIVVKKGKYGMIELNGTVVIEPEYTGLQYMSSFLVIAVKNEKYGIRTIYDNTVALPFEYKFISYKKGTGVAFSDKFINFRTAGPKVIIEGQ